MTVSVLFVCLGNICRSPTADGVLRQRIAEAGWADVVRVDSAGTGDWHLGKGPDPRSTAAARERGYDLSSLRARQVSAEDFAAFDYVLAMDRSNLDALRAMCPAQYTGHLSLFLDFHPRRGADGIPEEVPDPYYGDEQGFPQVLDLVEAACDGLLAHLADRYRLPARP